MFLLAFLAVANLRRSGTGRRLVAVAANERAAAALGVSVFGAKIYAFGLSAALAATGGILLAFQTPTVTFSPTFDVFGSISMVVYAVIGGVGAALGAVVGAGLAPGAAGAYLLSFLGDDLSDVLTLFSGLLLVIVLLTDPNGLVSYYRARALRLSRWLGPRRQPLPRMARRVGGACVRAAPATLALHELTVRFGGVTALDAVSLAVGPGRGGGD